MNYAHFGLFTIYAFSILFSGIGIYNFIDRNRKSIMNSNIYLGEALLLGSIFLVGELLVLSFVGLYKAPYLWGIVLVNYAFLLNKDVRNNFFNLIIKKISLNLPNTIFAILLLILIFRNCCFMVDVDSLGDYLFVQRLWLEAGTSLTGGVTDDMRVFVPHFNVVPYSLGISIFGLETLFPQLVDLFWRLIVLLLVFGYVGYRFNKYYGLAAVMFILFNDHFFYSGVNHWVILNGAVIGFLFAGAYNIWESRVQNSPFRFLLALIFLSQLMANKYQMAYVFCFMLLVGLLIQYNPIKRIKELLCNKRWICVLVIAVFFTSLWYIRNLIMTGDPVFPVFAGKLGIFNWTPEREHVLARVQFMLKPMSFLKYMNFFFIWPGIGAAKGVIVVISFLPLILGAAIIRSKIERDLMLELCFWLGLAILAIMGTCFTNWQGPRAYRYSIGILSFAAVFSIHFVLKYCFRIRKEIFLGGILLLISFVGGGQNEGFRVISQIGGGWKRPTFKENIGVIFNKLHMDYFIKKHYPEKAMISKVLNENKEKLNMTVRDRDSFLLPAYLHQIRPVVSLWFNSTIKWDSYESENLIVKDLKKYGFRWVLKMRGKELVFLTIEEYAKEAVKYERYPKRTWHDYGFPDELKEIKY